MYTKACRGGDEYGVRKGETYRAGRLLRSGCLLGLTRAVVWKLGASTRVDTPNGRASWFVPVRPGLCRSSIWCASLSLLVLDGAAPKLVAASDLDSFTRSMPPAMCRRPHCVARRVGRWKGDAVGQHQWPRHMHLTRRFEFCCLNLWRLSACLVYEPLQA